MMTKKTKTTNPDQIKLRQYEKKYDALLANREKFETEIDKIDEKLVELGEKIETLKGKLGGAISLSFSWNTVLLIILIVMIGWVLLSNSRGRPEYAPQPANAPTSYYQSPQH